MLRFLVVFGLISNGRVAGEVLAGVLGYPSELEEMKPAASIDVYRVALHRVLGASVFRQLPGLLALTASALTVAGCNVGLTAPNSTQSSDTVGAAVNLDAGPDSVTVMPESGSLDAGSNTTVVPSPALATSGSPLCNTAVLGLGCDPDKPACVFDADAGPDSGVCTRGAVCSPQLAGPAIATAACRVVAGFSKPSPSCSTAFGSGREGDRCTNSADCDIDFECIGDSTLGTCKRYCCDGPTSCTDSDSYCDIEALFHGINLVPVCTFGVACTPFTTECSAGETCTLVNEATGQTACVTPGPASVGMACTTEKCQENLACISDTCQQLCKLSVPGQCSAPSQTCIASSLFGAYSDVGLCSDGA